MARIYLVNDILRNCTTGGRKLWPYRYFFEWQLPEIMISANKAFHYAEKTDFFKSESFKSRIKKILKVWEDWAIFDQSFMAGLYCQF